jgi:D-alanyl-D-alanine carboxypeptidase (penicillin-binding protein 5/6)
VVGDSLSVRELLMATLISSGDDAVYALAEHLGGGGGEAGVEAFVEEMNREAERLGLNDTRFENPDGFDARGHHTSARALARMTRLAMRYPEFREMVATEYASIFTLYGEIPLANTNELLFSYPPATGVKTGTTPAAGEALVSSAAVGGEAYACVVLDAGEDRFAASVRALEYGFAAYDRPDLVVEGRRYAGVDVP